MNFQADWRNRRAHFLDPMYTIANYYTDSNKSEMKHAFGEDLFHNLHLIPEPLKKNLADTLPTSQKDMYEPPQPPNMEYSRLSGIASFFSGVMSALSGAVFRRARSPDAGWQSASDQYKNGHELSAANVDMSECGTAAACCEDKLNRVRRLLNKKNTNRYLARPRKVFVDASHVEEHFEDAFSPEDFVGLANDTIIEYFSPLQYQEHEYYEVDAPKTMVNRNTDPGQKTVPEVSETVETSECDNTRQVVSSCEDKLSKLKALLQSKKNVRTDIVPATPVEVPSKPSKSIPIAKPKDKKFKNPHRLCVEKRQKARMKQDIQEDMLFAEEIQLDESSVENSPSFHSLETDSLERLLPTPITVEKCECDKQHETEYFDEISGRFRSTSASSDDSFQIVFTDIPQRVRNTSECDSEDSFIVFQDSPDSCYTSNDVFGDSDESDSDCDMKLPQALSRTVSNLTDDSLYDEVDCARSADVNTGLLVDERKKALKKHQPAKKVRFSPAAPRVLVMRVWAFAARQARPGHWERFARDRERFQRRIADVDMAVSWVLKPQHRARVMFQRFMPWWNQQKRKELEDNKRREQEERAVKIAAEHDRDDSNTEADVSDGGDETNEDVSKDNENKPDNTQNGFIRSDADETDKRTFTNTYCVNNEITKCGEVIDVLDKVRSDADLKYESPKTIMDVASI